STTGHWLLATGYWLLATGYWLLATGYWLLATGYWLLAVGCWLLAVGWFQGPGGGLFLNFERIFPAFCLPWANPQGPGPDFA
ncbi:MAG: hypothetical protein ACK5KS_15660, partial [Planctomyces sp.]